MGYANRAGRVEGNRSRGHDGSCGHGGFPRTRRNRGLSHREPPRREQACAHPGRYAAAAVASGLLGCLFAPASAFAGGFYAPYQSSTGNAAALAGATAGTGDPSGLFFNPAANASLQGHQVYVDAKLFIPDLTLIATTATTPDATFNQPVPAGSAGDLADIQFAPNVYASYAISDRLKLGIAFSGPFAAKIDADPTWAGRYQLTKTDVTTYAATISLAYRLHETLAVGAGVAVQYMDGVFERVEVGPGGADFVGYLEGDDVQVGFNAGMVWTPREGTRVGLAYRSEMNHSVNGMAGLRGFTPADATADYDFTLPQVVSLGIHQALSDKWTLLGEAQWQDSSSFKGFYINLGASAVAPASTDVRAQDWDDSWIFALGAQYRPDARSRWIFGAHYDTAVSDGGGNTITPDGDRVMIGIGYERQVSEGFRWSAHYAHVFYDDAAINVAPSATNEQGTLVGSMETDLHMFGVSGTFTW